MSNPYLRRLFIGPDGTVYLASNVGLYVLTGERQHYTTGHYHSMSIYSMVHHPSGTLFLGTLGGLYALEGEEIVKAEAPLPVIDKPVYFIVTDHGGDTWFGTDNGVYRWDGELPLRHYTLEDGLIGRETNRAAGLVDSRGQLWIGMERGVTVYRPQFDAGYATAPRVYLGLIDVGGVPQSPKKRIELPYEHNSMTFRFHVPSFVNEDHVRVQSRLVGAG